MVPRSVAGAKIAGAAGNSSEVTAGSGGPAAAIGISENGGATTGEPSIGMAVGAATLGVLVFGILPSPLIDAANDAAAIFAR